MACITTYKGKKAVTYGYVVYGGMDPTTGKKKQFTKCGFENKKNAARAACVLEASLYTGALKPFGEETEDITVRELIKRWYEDKVVGWQPKTIITHDEIINNHILPELGNILMSDLRLRNIHFWISKMMKTVGSNGKLPSQRTVERRLTVLSAALNWGIDLDYVVKNPATRAKVPKTPKFRPFVMDEDLIKVVLSIAYGTYLEVPLHLAFYTGARRAELLGLQWKNVNFGKKLVSIETARILVGSEVKEGPTKTEESFRDITLADETVELLMAYKEEQIAMYASLGKRWTEENYVLLNTKGEPFHPGSFSTVVKRLFVKAGMEKARVHDTRHAHGTQLASLGVSPKVVQERFGHSDGATTQKYYIHALPKDIVAAAQSFADSLNGAD